MHYHSELYKSSSYHIAKTDACTLLDIRLIHLYEDDWMYKQPIVKSRLKSIFGFSDRIIYARKCIIREISYSEMVEFLEKNHLQGACQAKYKYGLYLGSELVSVMTFGLSRFEKNKIELLRFCNVLNANVVGGAGKLFSAFIKSHNPKTVISYADRSWSIGNVYEKIGFELVSCTSPNYQYVIGDKRFNRLHYQKHKLVKEGYDPNKTEHEIMLDRGIYRIYDSGSLKYEWNSP